MKKLREITAATVLLVVSAILCVSAEASDTHYSEDFTTTTYKDVLNTTALWDTVSGELKLPPFGLQLVGSCDTPGEAHTIAVSGDYAYVADKETGLQVVDISDPANPILAGSVDTPGYAFSLFVSGDYAYVADGYAGLRVIDISDPATPALSGSYDTPGDAYHVVVSGDYAYVADRSGGLQVIDISDPANPAPAGSYNPPGLVHGVAIAGDYVYIGNCHSTCHFLAVDIKDPTNPALAGACDMPLAVYEIYISGDYAYSANVSSGFQVIDISDPTTPILAGSYPTPDMTRGVAISGDYAYMTNSGSPMLVLDISDPTVPTPVGSCDTPGYSFGVVVSGNYAYVADGPAGLQVFRIAEPVLPPVQVAVYNTPGQEHDMVVSGNYAYIADDDEAGLTVVDITDPLNPVYAGGYNTPLRALNIDIDGDYVYMTDYWPGGSNKFFVLNVSNPSSPSFVGSYSTPDHISGLDVEGNYAYVCNSTYGLKVLDISNPTNPTLAGSLTTSDNFGLICVDGDYAYVGAANDGFLVVDISDPTSPVKVGSCATPSQAFRVEIAGDYAYVGGYEAGLLVIDISDPTSPALVASHSTPWNMAWSVTIEGDYAWVCEYGGGFSIFDISDPLNPVLLENINTPTACVRAVIEGDYAYVTCIDVGMLVYQAFQRSIDTENNTGVSLAVNALKRDIAKVQLETTEVGTINWSVSADNGVHWEPIVPGAGWHSFTHTGSELLWKSEHIYDITQPVVNPTCSFLEMEWIYSHIEVGFDIKPGSCPNPFNVNDDTEEDDNGEEPNKEYAKPRKGGVLPAAIVGSADFDVNDINVSTILLEGIEPLRSNYEDVTRPVEDGGSCACTNLGPDGYLDLTLKFNRIAIAEALGSVGNGEVVELTITGSLLDGTSFEGSDCVTIVGKRSSMPRFEEIDVVELAPPVPNPFNPMTSISYSVPDECTVSLEIFDSSGKLIVRLLDNVTVSRGVHTVEWRGVDRYGRAVDSGVYFYRLIAGNEIISRKMVLLR